MNIRPAALALLALGSAAQALLQAPIPFLIQRAFSLTMNKGSLLAFAATIGLMVAAFLGSEAITTGIRLAALRVTKPGTERLRGTLAAAITQLPVDLVEPQSPYLHDVYVHDTERVDVLLTVAVGQMLPAFLLVVGLSLALAVPHPGFGVATLISAAVVATAERATRKQLRRRLDAAHQTFGEFSRGAWSMLSGFLVTRAHAAEGYEAGARATEATLASRAAESVGRATAMSNFIGRCAAALVFGGLLLLAGVLVQRGSISIPAMLAITSTVALLRGPLFTLGQVAPQAQEGWRSWNRVSALLDAAAEIPHGDIAPPEGAPIDLDRLECRWGQFVLFRDVSFTLGVGDVVALTGPNGAGKSTLIRQILGLTAPTDGAIRVGGIPLDRLDLVRWRRLVGVVLQKTWFFDGSIFENLTYGTPAATRAMVWEACRLAHIDDFVGDLPAGLDTRIGDDGLRLSEGQRQRLAIARALVRRPRLLILDEPTNHLDEMTARDIIYGLIRHPERPTILLVTHQTQFAAIADRAFRLADGQLTPVQFDRSREPGTHAAAT